MDIKITVIIPVYKVEKYLNRCIESVVKQAYKNLEIVLVDDGSPDNCPKICDEWAKKDKRIKVIHKENRGVSSARNSGLKIASGDYITFLDGDDAFSDQLSTNIQLIDKSSDLVIAPISKLGKEQETKINKFIKDWTVNKIYSFYDFNIDLCLSSCCSKFIKSTIAKNQFFITTATIGEDMEYMCRIYSKSKSIRVINEPFYEYLIREDSVMQTDGFKKAIKLLNSTISIMDSTKENDLNILAKKQLLAIYSENLYGIFKEVELCDKEEKKQLFINLKQNKLLFSYARKKSKRFFYMTINIFGFKIAHFLLKYARKFKLID